METRDFVAQRFVLFNHLMDSFGVRITQFFGIVMACTSKRQSDHGLHVVDCILESILAAAKMLHGATKSGVLRFKSFLPGLHVLENGKHLYHGAKLFMTSHVLPRGLDVAAQLLAGTSNSGLEAVILNMGLDKAADNFSVAQVALVNKVGAEPQLVILKFNLHHTLTAMLTRDVGVHASLFNIFGHDWVLTVAGRAVDHSIMARVVKVMLHVTPLARPLAAQRAAGAVDHHLIQHVCDDSGDIVRLGGEVERAATGRALCTVAVAILADGGLDVLVEAVLAKGVLAGQDPWLDVGR